MQTLVLYNRGFWDYIVYNNLLCVHRKPIPISTCSSLAQSLRSLFHSCYVYIIIRTWVCKIWILVCVYARKTYLFDSAECIGLYTTLSTNPPKHWTELKSFFLYFTRWLVLLNICMCMILHLNIYISIEWGWLAQWGPAPSECYEETLGTSYIGPFSLLVANAKVFHNGRRFSFSIFSLLLRLNILRRNFLLP